MVTDGGEGFLVGGDCGVVFPAQGAGRGRLGAQGGCGAGAHQLGGGQSTRRAGRNRRRIPPYKRGVTGLSSPVAPTRQDNLVTAVSIRHWLYRKTAGQATVRIRAVRLSSRRCGWPETSAGGHVPGHLIRLTEGTHAGGYRWRHGWRRRIRSMLIERTVDLAEPDRMLFLSLIYPSLIHPAPGLLECHARQHTAEAVLSVGVLSRLARRSSRGCHHGLASCLSRPDRQRPRVQHPGRPSVSARAEAVATVCTSPTASNLSGPKPSLSSRRARERRSNTAFVRCGGARLSRKLRI